VVQWRQLGQFPDFTLDIRGDPHSGGVAIATVNDAIADGLHVVESCQRCRGT
jgi:hypothetical protein